jgi:hypothetical protein
MIADALCVRGIEVVHILDTKHSVVHPMTSAARVVGGALSYAPAPRAPACVSRPHYGRALWTRA